MICHSRMLEEIHLTPRVAQHQRRGTDEGDKPPRHITLKIDYISEPLSLVDIENSIGLSM